MSFLTRHVSVECNANNESWACYLNNQNNLVRAFKTDVRYHMSDIILEYDSTVRNFQPLQSPTILQALQVQPANILVKLC